MPIVRNILSEYIEKAMEESLYDKLEAGTFAGRIPSCTGVLTFGTTLEDWILVGLKLKHPLPVIRGIDLNKEPSRESVDAM